MSKLKVAVIGCGIFGALAALKLSHAGRDVTIFEAKKIILSGASYNNQNRLHLGYHYPRDLDTAIQCRNGFDDFVREFPGAVRRDFLDAYFIASSGSLTSPNAYLDHLNKVGLVYVPAGKEFPVNVFNTLLGCYSEEAVYDHQSLKDNISNRLLRSTVNVRTNTSIISIKRKKGSIKLADNHGNDYEFDAVVNCTYADIGRLTQELGYEVKPVKFEYTLVPIVWWPQFPVGITVMDGPFFSILPFGHSARFLLYGVTDAVIKEEQQPIMNMDWVNGSVTVSPKIVTQVFSRICKIVDEFVPSFVDARLVGYLSGPRMVLAGAEYTDARPSIVEAYDKNYITVFSGKIDHSISVADKVVAKIAKIG